MQQTSFSLEIIICDDASTDNTANIIKEYERKYPNLVRGVYQKENQYSKGLLPYPNTAWPQAKGKYIALCEGDDYWTDPQKLQKQVDFLESHAGYTGCAHETMIQYAKELNQADIKCSIAKLPFSDHTRVIEDYTFEDIVKTALFQSSSLVFRNELADIPKCIYTNKLWDIILFQYLTGKGKIHFMREVMSVYRKHLSSLTIYSSPYLDRILYLNNLMKVYDELLVYYNGQYSSIIKLKLLSIHLELWTLYKKDGDEMNARENYRLALEKKPDWISFSKQYLKNYNVFLKHYFYQKYHKVRRALRQSVKKIVKPS